MAKEKYRLQTVLDLRERAKKDAAQLVALRRQQLAQAEEELARREQAVVANIRKQKEASDTMLAEMQAGTEARKILQHRQHLSNLRDEEAALREAVKKQEKAVEQAAAEVEKAVAALAEAAKEVKVIETHRENWRTTRKIESERREQKLNDEIGAILFQNSKK